ncbi:MAG: bifunctional acetate--CoA ligase family protein/GNAT family N-acetyltransferase [Sphingomonas sp.]
MTVRNLEGLFHPRSVAVIGGSSRPGSLGELVLSNILDGGFEGAVFAVNPRRVEREGAEWVDSIAALPEAPDLAVIVTPAHTVAGIVRALGARGTRAAVVISAGLDAGAKQELLDAAKPYLLRIVGPNCLGALLPQAKLNASFAPRKAAPGRVAFVSQSGALVTAMLDWAADRHVGFSGIVSVGDMADVDLGDLIDMFAADPRTDAILLYVEAVTNPAKFMSAARAASRVKPVIAIKAGKSAASGKAAMSHTGALVGAYDVYEAAFRRAGIILVDSLTELFDAAQVLCRHRSAPGERLAIVTNGGGAGVLAADALLKTGGRLAALAPETIAALDPYLPSEWSRANPIDVIGDAHADRFARAARAALDDADVDALLVMHCPTAVETGTDIARGLVAALPAPSVKPVIACWMGPRNADAARALFDAAGIPLFDNLDDAIAGFGYLLQAREGQRALMRAPASVTVAATDRARAREIIAAARAGGRTMLDALESKTLAAAYGVPVVQAKRALTAAAVADACAGMPAPYAVKLISPQFAHKSDVGGVSLGIATAAAAVAAAEAMAERLAREHPEATIAGFEIEPMIERPGAQEVIVGIAEDATFGPVLAFGAGGKAVELLHDRALGLPPLDDALARDMIDRTRIARLLAGYRDVPAADVAGVVGVLNALSAIAVDLPDVIELDINPLLVDAKGVIALDARIRISEAARESRLVIRPVPMEWAADLATRSGLTIHVRPVRPDDEEALGDFFRHVSAEDRRFRFLTALGEVGHERLVAMTQIDYRRTMHFLAFDRAGTLIASAMLAADPDRVRAELAVSVRSDFKNRGVSWTLVQHVLRFAAAEGIQSVESIESRDNHAALALEREAGFTIAAGSDPAEVIVRRPVGAR